MPKQFLKRVERTGFGEFLFYDWAKEPGWDLPRQPDPRRRARTSAAAPRASTRRGALQDYGFQAIVAPSFADIFYSNCTKIGLLPVVLSEADCRALARGRRGRGRPARRRRSASAGRDACLRDRPRDPHRLLDGLDDIALTLAAGGAIAAYEAERERAGRATASARERESAAVGSAGAAATEVARLTSLAGAARGDRGRWTLAGGRRAGAVTPARRSNAPSAARSLSTAASAVRSASSRTDRNTPTDAPSTLERIEPATARSRRHGAAASARPSGGARRRLRRSTRPDQLDRRRRERRPTACRSARPTGGGIAARVRRRFTYGTPAARRRHEAQPSRAPRRAAAQRLVDDLNAHAGIPGDSGRGS